MRRKRNHSIIGLDSLVDIVSNNVGILIILTVFMAIISLIEAPENKEKKEQLITTHKVIIPWTHDSQKSGLWFLIRDNRLLFFDRALVYEKLRNDIKQTSTPQTHFGFDGYSVDLTVLSPITHCLDITPEPQAGEWWYQPKTLERLINTYSPSEFYFYFWVDADSFEMFHEVRDFLWKNNFETGWKPITTSTPISYCSGASRLMGFQPQ